MNAISSGNFESSRIASVTVTYNPDLRLLERQLNAIPAGCFKVIVDNGSENKSQLVKTFGNRSRVKIFLNSDNLGLAAAINQGVSEATRIPGISHVLLLDQDSEPDAGAVERLFASLLDLEGKHGPCAVGPRMMDVFTGLHHGFHVMTRWRWLRAYPSRGGEPIACANLNGSGTMISISAWKKSGGMESGLFIDHVDTEWSFRMLSKDISLYGVPDADFSHNMGVGSRKVWFFGWHVLPVRSPIRHYYLYRNTLRLMRRGYVPAVWKFWATVKMAVTIIMVLIFGPDRLKQISSIAKGLRDGFL